MKLVTKTSQYISEDARTYGWSEHSGIHALASVVNSLAAAGAVCPSVEVRIDYPSHSNKSQIYTIEKKIKKTCKTRGYAYVGSSLYENPMIDVPMITVHGLARAPKEEAWCKDRGRAGGEIVLSKWVGMDGMIQIADEKREELGTRFSADFLRQILSYREAIFTDRELSVAKAMGVSVVRQITEGGIFAALFELSKETKTGLDVNMKKISILQETVEVCEHFRINPYQLTSTGSFLYVTDDGEALADALKQQSVMASVIGRVTDDQDKIIRNGEDVRYIDRPAPDKIYGIWRNHHE